MYLFSKYSIKQIDECPMSDPISVVFADIYMSKMEDDAKREVIFSKLQIVILVKISIIPNAVFYKTFPRIMKNKLLSYPKTVAFCGQAYYSIKDMVTQRSSALQEAPEMAHILSQNHTSFSRFYVIFNGGWDCRIHFLLVKTFFSSICFLVHDFKELIVCHTASGNSHRNKAK